jgi:CTD kinase subunit beta
MLEASGFDFRNRHPQKLLVKLAKHYAVQKESDLAIVAYCMSLNLNRTFSLLKQTTATMAFACLELTARLLDDRLEEVGSGGDYGTWKTTREEIMGNSPHILDSFAWVFIVFFFHCCFSFNSFPSAVT